MASITLDFPLNAFSALRLTPEEFGREMKLAACVQWYAQSKISQGKAAEMAGLTRREFLRELARRKVPICQISEGELTRELEHIRARRR